MITNIITDLLALVGAIAIVWLIWAATSAIRNRPGASI